MENNFQLDFECLKQEMLYFSKDVGEKVTKILEQFFQFIYKNAEKLTTRADMTNLYNKLPYIIRNTYQYKIKSFRENIIESGTRYDPEKIRKYIEKNKLCNIKKD